METIEIHRGTASTDRDGNTIMSDPVLWRSLPALVTPAQQAAASDGESLPVEYDYTLYLRSREPSGIREDDLVSVRGHMTRIVGQVASWLDRSGRHVGDVVTVKRKEG